MNWLAKMLGLDDVHKKLDVLMEENQLPERSISDLQLVDPIGNDVLFSVEELEINKFATYPLVKVNENSNHVLQLLSAIPDLTSKVSKAKTYSFQFPKGVSGDVMKIGNGQGTAIMKNGRVQAHGYYTANIARAVPQLAMGVINLVVEQHYLGQINRSLADMDKKLGMLLNLEFIKQEAKIEAMISLFRKAHKEYELMEHNVNYKNAYLTNIIGYNVTIYELMHFYRNAIENIDSENTEELKNSFKYFMSLHELFVFGKLLEFKYAGEYNRHMIENLKTEFEQLARQFDGYVELKTKNTESLKNDIDFKWYDNDWLVLSMIGDKKGKEQKISRFEQNTILLKEFLAKNEQVSLERNTMLDELATNLYKPQQFIVKDGEFYQVMADKK